MCTEKIRLLSCIGAEKIAFPPKLSLRTEMKISVKRFWARVFGNSCTHGCIFNNFDGCYLIFASVTRA